MNDTGCKSDRVMKGSFEVEKIGSWAGEGQRIKGKRQK